LADDFEIEFDPGLCVQVVAPSGVARRGRRESGTRWAERIRHIDESDPETFVVHLGYPDDDEAEPPT